MSFWYTPMKGRLARAQANLDTMDLRVLMVMSNTTADTDQDAATIAAIGTLDECDGANYVRVDLGDPTVSDDNPNNRAEISVAAFTVGGVGLGAGTRSNVGLLVYEHVATDADHRPVAFIDSGGFPFNGNGLPVNVTPNVEGLLQVT